MSVAIDALVEVNDPLIVASLTSKVIVFALTAVVIGPAPVNVNVSPDGISSAVPEFASTVNVVLIPAISDAILADVEVNDPLIFAAVKPLTKVALAPNEPDMSPAI